MLRFAPQSSASTRGRRPAVCVALGIRRPIAQRLGPGLLAGATNERHEVLPGHAGVGLGEFDELCIGQVGAIGEHALHGAGGAELAGEGAGVDTVDAQDAGTIEVAGEVAVGAVVGVQPRKLADDHACDLDLGGFDILGVGAGVADEREGLDEDLAGVRRIGERFLIAAGGGIEDHLCAAQDVLADRAKAVTNENRAVGKGQTRHRTK
jgi:hypothetical protein